MTADQPGQPFTEAEIATMEADEGDHLLPLHIRRAIAQGMRDQNTAARRWSAMLAPPEDRP